MEPALRATVFLGSDDACALVCASGHIEIAGVVFMDDPRRLAALFDHAAALAHDLANPRCAVCDEFGDDETFDSLWDFFNGSPETVRAHHACGSTLGWHMSERAYHARMQALRERGAA